MALHRLVASLLVAGSLAGTAPPAFAQTDADSYFEFLMARRLEGAGDFAGAQAALDRAVQGAPRSAELRGQIASFYLRRSQPDEAEKAAKASLSIDENNIEAHRALGLVYAGYADAATGARANAPETAAYLKDAITHLERAAAAAATGDLVLHFTLGRLYLRTDQTSKAVDSLNRVVSLNPGSMQARLALAQAHAANKNLPQAIDTLDLIVEDEPRVAAALGQYQEQAGRFEEAAASYTKALEVNPMSREIKSRRIAALFGADDLAGAASAAADAQRQHPDDRALPAPAGARAVRRRQPERRTVGARRRRAHVPEGLEHALPAGGHVQGRRPPAGRREVAAPAAHGRADQRQRDELSRLPAGAARRSARRGDRPRAQGAVPRAGQRRLPRQPRLGLLPQGRSGRGREVSRTGGHASCRATPKCRTIWATCSPDAAACRTPSTAWTRALDGDGCDIDRAEIQKKINDARSKIRK